MAYPPILVDQDGNPIPQRWHEAESKWEPYEGIILGPDGQPISSSNPLHVIEEQLRARIGALNDAAVTNPASNASVIAALKGILTDLGQISDAMVSAGATGSVSAKLRRLTNDVDQLLSRLGQTSDAAADAGAAGSVHAKLRRLTADLAALKTEVDKLTALIEDGALKTTLSGQIKDIAANRPDADSVDVGTVYWSVDTGDVSVSTGTEWRSLGVA